MKKITDPELRQIQLDILKYINETCEKNDIFYSLSFGTMLGAVRHHGYIPWDDDIDICMDRENFERFVSVCKLNQNERYELLWLDTNKEYTLPLPKMVDKNTVLIQNALDERSSLGVYVDVFVCDKIPNDKRKLQKFIKKLNTYQKWWGYSQMKYVWRDRSVKSFVRRFVYGGFHLVNPRVFAKKLNKYAQKYNNNQDADHISPMVYNSGIRGIPYFPCDFFDSCIKMTFEDADFPVSRHYDEALRIHYGDYMKLPPEDKQVSHHDFEVYYKN